MHQLTDGFLRAVVTVLVATALSLTPALACERLWVADRELWIADGDQARLVVRDERGVDLPAWSPRGERVAYAHTDGETLELRIVSRTGEAVRTVSVPQDTPVNAILEVGWRSEQRVFAVGHVNPSTSMYLEWDLGSGRLVESIPGSHFAISPDGRSLAYRANVPHGTPKPYDSDTLMIGDRAAWPVAGDQSYHRFSGGPAWSNDGRVAVIDRGDDENALVTIDVRRNTTSRATLPSDVRGDLVWTPAGEVSIRSGNQLWIVEPATGRTGATQGPASEQVAPPRELSERLPGRVLRAGGSRCSG